MKKLVAALVAACLVSAALLAIPALAATKTVSVRDNVFGPKTLSVARGTTVKWVWHGRFNHNVVVQTGPQHFRSPLKKTGSYSKRLTRRGTYRLLCEVHPGMGMTIRVR